MPIQQRLAAEAIGTCFLLMAVVGSGIMAQRLCGSNVGLALLANTLATGAALLCLIGALGPISGGHFNPAVSLADALQGGLRWPEMIAYALVQIIGGIIGVLLAHLMFALPGFFASSHVRTGPSQWLAEFVATFGLLLIIWGCVRYANKLVPFAVASYIVAAYWFTSSTSFANPAVTIARSLSDTFAGIRPLDAPAFVIAQLCGAVAATFFVRWLAPVTSAQAERALLPHSENT